MPGSLFCVGLSIVVTLIGALSLWLFLPSSQRQRCELLTVEGAAHPWPSTPLPSFAHLSTHSHYVINDTLLPLTGCAPFAFRFVAVVLFFIDNHANIE